VQMRPQNSVAVCCSGIAVCCNVLQFDAVCGSELQCVAKVSVLMRPQNMH